MKNVSVYLDLDWVTTYLQESGFALTTALIAQQILRSAHPFGTIKRAVAYGDPANVTEGVKETLDAEGFRFAAQPVEALLLEEDGADEFSEETILLISGNVDAPLPFEKIRKNGCDLVLWHGSEDTADPHNWDRTDILNRVMKLHMNGIGVFVDFEGLVSAIWESSCCEDVESLLECIDSTVGVEGTILTKVACADWHTLRVLRDRDGNPITHEAERICRNAGYMTFDAAQGRIDTCVSALEHLLSRGSMMDSVVYVGGDIGKEMGEALDRFAGTVDYWAPVPIAVSSGHRWRNVKDMFNGSDGIAGEQTGFDTSDFVPGLWSRVGLHVDRILSANGHEWISGAQLSRHFTKYLGIIKIQKQAEVLIHTGVRNGVIRRRARGSFHRDLFTLNEAHKELVLIRELLKSLLEIIGNDPTRLRAVPVYDVVDRLRDTKFSVSGTPLSKESIRSWLSFLVDEGILLRLTLPDSRDGTISVPSLTFSPEPPSVRAEQTKKNEAPTALAKNDSKKKNASRSRSTELIDYIIVTVDNYMIRHGKDHAPVQAIKRQIAGYGDRAVSGAIQQGLKNRDFIASRRGNDKDPTRNGIISLGTESQHVRQVISKKQRVIDLLRRMAPMGQPMGEGRIRSAFVNDLRMRNEKEATEWITILRKEGLLKPDQIVSELGQSFTLSLDDPVVVKNKNPSVGRKHSSRSRRPNRSGDKRRFSHRRNR